MNDLLTCRSCNVPPRLNCISFKGCPYESVDCNFRATKGAQCLCLLITKGNIRFNGERVVLLLRCVKNFGLTQLRSCITNIH